MASRAEDWFRQAVRDLGHARDSLYITPRYPNTYPEGAPMDFYTRADAERAIAAAERILEHCKSHLLR